jgi:hypothetical protein
MVNSVVKSGSLTSGTWPRTTTVTGSAGWVRSNDDALESQPSLSSPATLRLGFSRSAATSTMPGGCRLSAVVPVSTCARTAGLIVGVVTRDRPSSSEG